MLLIVNGTQFLKGAAGQPHQDLRIHPQNRTGRTPRFKSDAVSTGGYVGGFAPNPLPEPEVLGFPLHLSLRDKCFVPLPGWGGAPARSHLRTLYRNGHLRGLQCRVEKAVSAVPGVTSFISLKQKGSGDHLRQSLKPIAEQARWPILKPRCSSAAYVDRAEFYGPRSGRPSFF